VTSPGRKLVDLWPLSAGADRELERAVQAGELGPAEAENIRSFADKGYVIFPRAVPEALVDRLVHDVRKIAEMPGFFLTTDHRNGRNQALSGPDFDSYESIFDTYVNLDSARRVCFHATLTHFLELVFRTPVIGTQQLLFQRSNQHPLHQDTSVVCTEEPLSMVASWIALEDVVPGRGELTYYEGSHKIDHYPYADGSKRFDPNADDAEAVRRHLLSEIERLGCRKRDFIAEKGDVFVWAADLVHGSNPRTRPDAETRMSLVTHYCPRTTKPFWFRFHPRHRRLESFEGRVEYASQYYVLPTNGKPAKPILRS
jgi:phytanoyl-CoA hydroxylase